MRPLGTISTVVAVVLLALTTEGVSNNNPNGNGRPQYSLSQHVSFDPYDDSLSVSAETEAVAFYSDDEGEPRAVGNPLFSANALSCSGGDLSGEQSSFIAMAECSFEARGAEFDSNFEDDEESDDDDDDDDDGHSSMLSNASVRRSLASANGASSPSSSYNPGSEKLYRRGNVVGSTMPQTNGRSCCTLNSVFQVRGGAVAAAASQNSEFAKRLLVAAIVTLLYEGAMGHLLEFVKIVMQTSPAGTSYWDVLRSITSEKGTAGMWDGFIPWGVVQAVAKGGVFGLAHAIALSFLLPLAEESALPKQLALTLAGGIAGGFQGYVLSPTLLLKTRVMTNPVFREKMSLLRTTLLSFLIGFEVVANEGIGALMKGSNVFATKRVFDWATRYYFSDVFEALLLKHSSSGSLTPGEKIAASLLGGTASTVCTLPLDVLVAKTQDAKKAGVKVSAFDMFKEELREGGWKGLRDSYMRGFEARLAHVCFTTVAMKTGTALMYDALFHKA